MKQVFSILAVMTLAVKLFGAETNASAPMKIGTGAATNYYDQVMTVTGRVAQVSIRPAVTFLNLDQPYPNSPFTVVIFHGHSSFYGDANALKGKTIEIKGKIKDYRDKPEIALDDLKQLTVLDAQGRNITSAVLQSTNAPAAIPPTNAPAAAPSTNSPEIM